MKKRIGAVLLAGMMACTVAASLAGCGGGAADFDMPEGGFDTSKEVTITFYHQMGAGLQNVLDDYIAVFNKMYPNIKVVHTPQGDWNGVKNTITTELQANSHPNIAYCYADHVAQYNTANAVLSLNDFLPDGAYKDYTVSAYLVNEYGEYVNEQGEVIIDEDGNALVEGAEPIRKDVSLNLTEAEKNLYNPVYYNEGYEFGDGEKMYTLPWIKSTEMMYYNEDFFKEHEKDGLKVPTTWDEMEDACKLIKELDPNCIPLGYDSEENWFISMCEQIGSEYTSTESPHFRFNNQKNKDFVQKFKEWKDKGYVTTSALSNVNYTSDLFKTKNIYMSIGSTGGATYNTDTSGETAAFQTGIAPVPQTDLNNKKFISQGPSVCIFKDDDPQKVLASWLFVKFFTTNALYQTEVAMSNGYMPVLKSSVMSEYTAYTDWIAKADGSTYLTALAVREAMKNESYYFVSPAFSGSSEARTQVGLLMQDALLGTKSIDEAFTYALNYCTSRYGD